MPRDGCEDCGGRVIFSPRCNVRRCHDCRERRQRRPRTRPAAAKRRCRFCGGRCSGRRRFYCSDRCRADFHKARRENTARTAGEAPLTPCELALCREWGVVLGRARRAA